MKRIWFLALVFFFLTYSNLALSGPICETETEEKISSFGQYTLTETVEYKWDKECLEFYVTGILLRDSVVKAVLKSPTKTLYEGGQKLNIVALEDFYWLYSWSGGAHCCSTNLFLNKEPPYDVVLKGGGHSYPSLYNIKDFDEDGKLEIRLYDDIFAYWISSFAGSPTIELYFEFSSNSIELDKNLVYCNRYKKKNDMSRFEDDHPKRCTPYSDPEKIEIKKEMKKGFVKSQYKSDGWEGYIIPAQFVQVISALRYTERDEEAKEFFDSMWPQHIPKKEIFWKSLNEILIKSRYWEYTE